MAVSFVCCKLWMTLQLWGERFPDDTGIMPWLGWNRQLVYNVYQNTEDKVYLDLFDSWFSHPNSTWFLRNTVFGWCCCVFNHELHGFSTNSKEKSEDHQWTAVGSLEFFVVGSGFHISTVIQLDSMPRFMVLHIYWLIHGWLMFMVFIV